jgi:hypothetical protein
MLQIKNQSRRVKRDWFIWVIEKVVSDKGLDFNYC